MTWGYTLNHIILNETSLPIKKRHALRNIPLETVQLLYKKWARYNN